MSILSQVDASHHLESLSPAHETLAMLLDEACAPTTPPGVLGVLVQVRVALDTGGLSPAAAHLLGMQLRLAGGSHPLDGDEDAHLLIEHILFELCEIVATIDGIHLDDVNEAIGERLVEGDVDAAKHLSARAKVARQRLRSLRGSLADQLRP